MPGGVVNLIERLKTLLSAEIQAEGFFTGRRPDEKGVLKLLTRVLGDTRSLFVRLRSRQYDVVHVNPSLDPKAVLRDAVLMLVLRLSGHRATVVFFHGWRPWLERRIGANPLYRRAFRWSFGGASRIAVQSEKFRAALMRLGFDPSRILMLPTMFDGDKLQAAAKDRGTEPRRRIVLFLARLIREKGIYELLEGFARIADTVSDADLIVVGDGPEAKGVRARIAELGLGDRIQCTGYVDDPVKARLLLDASIFVLPSYWEGMPVAVLEAMGAGAVLVVSNAGGMEDVVHSPENGLVLDQVTPAAIAAALARVLTDPTYMAEVSQRNSETAWRLYEARTVTRRIEGIYREVAAESRRP
jgi:glycosyltransferase involved in cell wall biosynthesis